jgi:hypothetical protein
MALRKSLFSTLERQVGSERSTDFIYTIFIFIKSIYATAPVNYTVLPEQLFLDYSLQDVLDNSSFTFVKPWAGEYVNTVLEGRYDDDIWARYHITGQVLANGTFGGTNLTVLDSIKEDDVEYKVNVPELFADALLLYAKSSKKDGHADVVKMISNISLEDISTFQERAIYSTQCSGG